MTEHERTEVIERPAGRPPPPWWRENWWIGLGLLALAGIALILWLVVGRDDGDRTTMPNVVGLQEGQARQRVADAGLEPDVVTEDGDAPPGEVIAQTPGAGAQLERGEEVTLTVSRGGDTTTVTQTETQTETETMTDTETEIETETETTEVETASMPDLTGQPLADAVAAALDLGLHPHTYPVPSDEEQGTVVAQRPQPGMQVEVTPTTTVRLNVALGSGEREQVQVPDLTGPELREALVACSEGMVTCRIVFRVASEPDHVGVVIDQEPAAGATVPILEQVTLAVGRSA